jgi:hypothetical protein
VSEISESAILEALPEMAAQRSKGRMIAAAIMVGAIALGYALMLAFDSWIGAAVPVILGLVLVLAVGAHVGHKQEVTLLPVIAKGFGLQHQKGDKSFVSLLPQGFVPQGDSQTVDDVLTGTVAGSSFTFAEYHTTETTTRTTGHGSDSRTESDTKTLFRGIVLIVQARENVPDFALRNQVVLPNFLGFLEKWVTTTGVAGLKKQRELSGPSGSEFGLWMKPQDAASLDRIAQLAGRLIRTGFGENGEVQLEAAAATQGRYILALKKNADMLNVGGLFVSQEKVLAQIRKVADEMAIPIRLATEVLELEKAILTRT